MLQSSKTENRTSQNGIIYKCHIESYLDDEGTGEAYRLIKFEIPLIEWYLPNAIKIVKLIQELILEANKMGLNGDLIKETQCYNLSNKDSQMLEYKVVNVR